MPAKNLKFAVTPHSDASRDTRSAVTKRCQEAFQKWHALYLDPEVWTDPAKRSAMYRARLGYQDVTMEWVRAHRL